EAPEPLTANQLQLHSLESPGGLSHTCHRCSGDHQRLNELGMPCCYMQGNDTAQGDSHQVHPTFRNLIGNQSCDIVSGGFHAIPGLFKPSAESRQMKGQDVVVTKGQNLRVPAPVPDVAAVQEYQCRRGPLALMLAPWM